MFDKPINPRVILKSGAALSIQASASHYCFPQEDQGPYTHYELGHPRGLDATDLALLKEYEDREGIYAYVPKKILDKIINSHGGFRVGQLP